MVKKQFPPKLIVPLSAFTPLAAFAAPENLSALASLILGIFDLLVAPIVGIATLAFIWGIILLIAKGDDARAHQDGMKIISFGIVALFVMVAVWGLVAVLRTTLLGG